jgi:hypothetical protein
MHVERTINYSRAASPVALLVAALLTAGCGTRDNPDRRYGPAVAADADLHPVRIHNPSALTGLRGGLRDPNGEPLDVPCATCHAGRTFPLPTSATELHGPHAGLRFRHGTNRCASCHDPADALRLRLADGRSIPMTEALTLCAQCHGPQARDYAHGAHGGMNGYWDLRRGGRLRNHCTDCHDPHDPAFPSFLPMPAPLDAPHRATAEHARAGAH